MMKINMSQYGYKPSLDNIVVKKTNDPEKGYSDENELFVDTLHHIDDVEKVMEELGEYLKDIGKWHDWSKISYFKDFKNDCLERLSTPDFKQRNWYNIHTVKERHHINSNCPKDVNLFDLLEMIVDCIVAGKTRSGEVKEEYLIVPDDILVKAYYNTVKLISEKIVVEDE